MTTLSNKIRDCRAGVYDNPYQGEDKKVVFVCSMGILRSATGARLYAHKYNTRTCGTWSDALIPLSDSLIQWADQIVFVNKENYDNVVRYFQEHDENMLLAVQEKSVVLNIPDKYPHMHPELIKAFEEQYEPIGDSRITS